MGEGQCWVHLSSGKNCLPKTRTASPCGKPAPRKDTLVWQCVCVGGGGAGRTGAILYLFIKVTHKLIKY